MPATSLCVQLLAMTPDAEALGVNLIRLLPTREDKSGHYRRWALFKCRSCGKEFEALAQHNAKLKSCGCQAQRLKCEAATKHGMARTRLYQEWADMKARCLNNKHACYHRYGGRGITITTSWIDFPTFAAWAMSAGYDDNLTIDRIDNDGGYSPENCRWVTIEENIQNRPKAKMVQKTCPHCQKTFEVKNGNRYRIFCSVNCKVQATVGRPRGDHWWKQNCA
jgi:hypothetical protein